ncbi:adenine phosphoribosyltransferase [Alcanivorax sp. 97CO-5]|jgi:hydroxymethylpyrimidine/phosphomethylpyrimidine kinase|uniref:bifunctional hydroxymethylpyrimidine kinase/phosphomethylpyrimidine kinase n=1 Tax=unclassified Alcanivorax TaxID=2638842 RepID=UPI0003E7F663|nr:MULTISPECIES: hydroxymethylpyrimidine/phosphomethylpyrimidine kinase [unclassified Alcanivorax]EUC67991.1 adenine phosphoribosyltransferase [Alcanivorax sp. 97CO-5]PKG00415.1 hydroxymethylpyrimidine/phosphomethylpyrimidine kinase [Alcanivorax sp. 97CO-6]
MKPNILVIAGHDPSGGAGIHADIEAIQALGGFASTLITGLTVQNSQNVRGFRLTEIDLLQQQADAVLDDMDYQAIKIGMTGSIAIVDFITQLLKRLPNVPVILDPVLAAEAGGSLAQESLAEVMLDTLAPLCDVMTPNLPEAQALSGQQSVSGCGQVLVQRSGCATLITGTHDDTDQVVNHLFTPSGEEQWHWDRLPHRYHGSGCTLASSIACLRGHGQSLHSAVANGQAHVDKFLRNAFQPGQGQYVPNRQP